MTHMKKSLLSIALFVCGLLLWKPVQAEAATQVDNLVLMVNFSKDGDNTFQTNFSRYQEMYTGPESEPNRSLSKYISAVKIHNEKEFAAALSKYNDVDILAEGTLEAVDTVTYNGVPGVYSQIKVDNQTYNRHYSGSIISYSWDTTSTEFIHSKEIRFLGQIYPYGTIPFSEPKDNGAVYPNVNGWFCGDTRHEIYTSPTNEKGVLYATIKNKKIIDTEFFTDHSSIDDFLNSFN